MFRWDCTVSPILWREYAVKPKPLRIFNARSQWCKNGKKYLRITETRQTGAVGNRTYRGGVNAARLETETTAGRKTTPLAPLIRGKVRKLHLPQDERHPPSPPLSGMRRANRCGWKPHLPGWSECSAVGNRNYRRTKDNPPFPLIRGKVRNCTYRTR